MSDINTITWRISNKEAESIKVVKDYMDRRMQHDLETALFANWREDDDHSQNLPMPRNAHASAAPVSLSASSKRRGGPVTKILRYLRSRWGGRNT